MKALTTIYLLLILTASYAQHSNGYWVANGCNIEHHKENSCRAYKGIYGNQVKKEVSVIIPDGFTKSFDIIDSTKGNYSFYKKVDSKEKDVLTIIVYSKKDKEYEYVTLSTSYMIVYKNKVQQMLIYKLL